jgi:putative hydrolase of the HAD superfamily
MPDYVFFDFAGTLVEGVPNWEHPQIVVCAECGLTVTPARVKEAIWKVWGPLEGCEHVEASATEDAYARWIGAIERQILAGLGLQESVLDRAARRVMELQVAPNSYRVYPDVLPTLESLRRRGLRLGIVSNFAWRLPELVAGLGLADRFDLILTSARVGYRKPRPEIFEHALATAGVAADKALYVGDDPECDEAGARAVGIRSLLIDRRRRAAPRVGQIRSLATLLDHLEGG